MEDVGLWNDYGKASAYERTSGRCELVKESDGKCGLVIWLPNSLSLWKDFRKAWAFERPLWKGVSLWKYPIKYVSLWNDYWKAWVCERTSGRREPVTGPYGKVWACDRIVWKVWACEIITEKIELVKGLLESVSLWKALLERCEPVTGS
jgi:hypothetical protein